MRSRRHSSEAAPAEQPPCNRAAADSRSDVGERDELLHRWSCDVQGCARDGTFQCCYSWYVGVVADADIFDGTGDIMRCFCSETDHRCSFTWNEQTAVLVVDSPHGVRASSAALLRETLTIQ